METDIIVIIAIDFLWTITMQTYFFARESYHKVKISIQEYLHFYQNILALIHKCHFQIIVIIEPLSNFCLFLFFLINFACGIMYNQDLKSAKLRMRKKVTVTAWSSAVTQFANIQW